MHIEFENSLNLVLDIVTSGQINLCVCVLSCLSGVEEGIFLAKLALRECTYEYVFVCVKRVYMYVCINCTKINNYRG